MTEKNKPNETIMEFADERFVLRSNFKGRKVAKAQAEVKTKSKVG